MKHPESILQSTCKKWFDLQYPKYKRLLFAIPNGGSRNKIEAAIMKGEGVEPGVSDMMLALPRNGWPGAFIEMKWGKNTLSEHQETWLELVKKQGYAIAVIYTFDEFMNFIERYLHAVKPENVENIVSRHYGIPKELLHAKTQKRTIAEPRQIVMTIIRETKGNNNAAAHHFNLDHATANHAKKVITNLYQTDPEFRKRMKCILDELSISETIIFKS